MGVYRGRVRGYHNMSQTHIPQQHALESYFGQMDTYQKKMLAGDRFAHETFNLPAAYKGKNQYLQDVLNYMITDEADFYMELLPWVETEDMTIKWEIFSFNKTLFDLEPNQGVPRYVTAEREARSDRLVRRGLGFIIEHGFYTTEKGRRHYLMNLRQITDAVTETAAHGVMVALLGAHQHYAQWVMEHGPRVLRTQDLQQRSRNNWGIVQKQERGLYLLDADVKDIMRYEGVTPDTLIFPSRMGMYASLVPSSETEFYRKGPGSVANLETGPATFQTFRGLRVHESRPFDVDFIGEPYDLLVRERQIGDYHEIPSNALEFWIYSMDADKFVNVMADKPDLRGKVIARPFRTYHMASAIWMKRGLETGMTAHGHHDFQLSDDTLRKVHIGHYTFWHKSIVKTPKNIFIAEDIFARGYVGGEGATELTALPEVIQGSTEDMDGSFIILNPEGGDLGKLANPIDISGEYSVEAFKDGPSALGASSDKGGIPGFNAENTPFNQLQRLRGNGGNNPNTVNPFNSPLRKLNTLCYRGMSIAVVDDGVVVVDSEAEQPGAIPTGETKGRGGRRRQVTLSTDHWGRNVYQGCRGARTGAMAFLKDMNYERGDFDKIPLA